MAEDRPIDPVKERRFTDWFREAWSQALLAVTTAEEDASRVLQRVGDLAGWRPEDARRYAKEFGERLVLQRKDFEKAVDDGVAKALSRVKIPRREEMEALTRRVNRIAERIEAIEAGRR